LPYCHAIADFHYFASCLLHIFADTLIIFATRKRAMPPGFAALARRRQRFAILMPAATLAFTPLRFCHYADASYAIIFASCPAADTPLRWRHSRQLSFAITGRRYAISPMLRH